MANNPEIGGKIVLRGEKEYREALAAINAGLKVNYAQMGLVSQQYADNADSTEALRAKSDALANAIQSQKDKVALLEAQLEKSAQKTGEGSNKTMQYQASLLKAQTQLEKMEQEQSGYAQALESSGEKTETLSEKITGLADKLGISLPPEVSKALNALNGIDGSFVTVAASAVALATALVAVEKKLYDLTAQAAQTAGDIGTAAQEYGITAEQVQMLAVAEEKLEVSNGLITQSMSKLTEKLASGSDAFKELGVEVTDSSGQYRSTLNIFYDVIDALGDVENETEANVYAQQLFGETFARLNPLVLAGSDTIKQYGTEAAAAGQIMSNETVSALDEVYQKNLDVERGWAAVTNALAASFAPAAKDADDLLTDDLLPVLKDLAESYGPMFADVLSMIAHTLDTMAPLLDVVALGFEGIALAIQLVATAADTLVQLFDILISKEKTLADFDSSGFQGIQTTLSAMGNTTDRLIGRNANGTDYWRGGMTWVGENGPELVSLPRGSRIYSNAESTARSVNNTYYCTIDARRIKEFNDVVKIAQSESTKIRQGVSREG